MDHIQDLRVKQWFPSSQSDHGFSRAGIQDALEHLQGHETGSVQPEFWRLTIGILAHPASQVTPVSDHNADGPWGKASTTQQMSF